ncbi:alpha-1,3/1,6-mannosyltransferase ALG2 [Cyclospora cayetanensis]|uniref:Alpha-1,3/1,6-mannosyltransferase ALG2 n=1 Tax=Cyclospora cayetanensis TaxID=88456 RepID=A0A6P6RTR7_9EIME|nr:alpha-1,3/1,6-mannosyltransferase ALG2 [Cyclospora cayetanensis]
MASLPQKVAFFHLDLGIGGAEQLVLETALHTHAILQNSRCRSHRVDFFTSHLDKHRCLHAAKDPRLNIIVFGSFLPQSILGRFRIVCSVLRMLYVVLAAIVTGHVGYDIAFNDQVAAINPLLYLIAMCSAFLVNSQFTSEAYCKTFPSLKKVRPCVLYPPISANLEELNLLPIATTSDQFSSNQAALRHVLPPVLTNLAVNCFRFDLSRPFALSLNRFEAKKNIELAIEAVSRLPQNLECNLIVAGGFDVRLPECSTYFHQLVGLSKQRNFCVLGSNRDASTTIQEGASRRYVLFLKNIPCEAMFVGCLPVACNSGGPKETIVHGETGFLCEPNAESFSAALEHILSLSLDGSDELAALRAKAQHHAETFFSPGVFRRSLQAILKKVAKPSDKNWMQDPPRQRKMVNRLTHCQLSGKLEPIAQ